METGMNRATEIRDAGMGTTAMKDITETAIRKVIQIATTLRLIPAG
jgi:hypothetical protein